MISVTQYLKNVEESLRTNKQTHSCCLFELKFSSFDPVCAYKEPLSFNRSSF